jgi:hypothetical protein
MWHLMRSHLDRCGTGSIFGIATIYDLDSPGIESRWEAKLYSPVQTGLGVHPASYKMGSWSFPGVENGRGVTLTPHHLLVPWWWKGRVIPLLSLWAVRTVQSTDHVGTESQCLYNSALSVFTWTDTESILPNGSNECCNWGDKLYSTSWETVEFIVLTP